MAQNDGSAAALKQRAYPNLWPNVGPKQQAVSSDEDHLLEQASLIKVGDRVVVSGLSDGRGQRLAVAKYVGRIAQIAPGVWVGVAYDEAVGKHDGSLGGTRLFSCKEGHGGFVRPNHVSLDPNAQTSSDKQASAHQSARHVEAGQAGRDRKIKDAADVGGTEVGASLSVEGAPEASEPGTWARVAVNARRQEVKANAVAQGGEIADALRRFDNRSKTRGSWKMVLNAAELDHKRAAASFCRVAGNGLSSSIVRQLGTFKVYAYDHNGNKRLSGGESVAVAVRGTSVVRARLVDNGDGSYTCKYRAWVVRQCATLPVSGSYNIVIWLNGEMVSGSPFPLIVLSTKADAPKCELRGAGLKTGVSREPATFEVDFVDAFGQVCYAEELDVYVELIHAPRNNPLKRAGLPLRDTDGGAQRASVLDNSFLEELRQLEEANASLANPPKQDEEIDVFAEVEAVKRREAAREAAKQRAAKEAYERQAGVVAADGGTSTNQGSSAQTAAVLDPTHVDNDSGPVAGAASSNGKPNAAQEASPAVPSYARLDAVERQQHMQLWTRRRATDAASGLQFREKISSGGARGRDDDDDFYAHTKRKDQVQVTQQSFDHELKADRKGVGFAYGGVSPGTLHARGQLIRTHTVSYSIGLAGKYKFYVGLRQQSAALPGSPFDLIIAPGNAFAPSTKLPKHLLPLSGIVGETWGSLTIFANDKIGNQCVRGGASVKMHVNSHEVKLDNSDNGDGSYGFKWRSERSGTYEVSVTINGVPVVNSPTNLTMLAANLDVGNCEASGSGLETATAGKPAVLRITCRDRFSNSATPSVDLKFGISLVQNESSMDRKEKRTKSAADKDKNQADGEVEVVKPVSRTRKEEKDEESREKKKRSQADALTPMPFDAIWVDGEYQISYVAKKAGDHQLHIWADPDGSGSREILPGSPFTLHVRENRPFAGECSINSQIEEGKAVFAGEKILLKPQLRDQFGNAAAADDDAVTALLTAPDGSQQLSVRPNAKALGSYDISHETSLMGEYTIHVQLDGHEIDGSPARFNVQPSVPTAVRSRLAPPENQPLTHQPCELVLTAVDKLGNTLDRGGARVDARVLGPNASPCTVEDHKDGRYTIIFTAGAVGEYRVIARLDNTELAPMPLQFAEGRAPAADAPEKTVAGNAKADGRERVRGATRRMTHEKISKDTVGAPEAAPEAAPAPADAFAGGAGSEGTADKNGATGAPSGATSDRFATAAAEAPAPSAAKEASNSARGRPARTREDSPRAKRASGKEATVKKSMAGKGPAPKPLALKMSDTKGQAGAESARGKAKAKGKVAGRGPSPRSEAPNSKSTTTVIATALN